ncbi:uncharacterized protein [Drosophila tropicalis]|uniref:uncharacterized protein n=1 Tax=Drosophila tropicalis TaxID=46794 RepID=UPI0035ABA201
MARIPAGLPRPQSTPHPPLAKHQRYALVGASFASVTRNGAALYVRVRYRDHFWTDSTIVLAWLNKPPCSWSIFVASICNSTSGQSWSHVRSEDNPADLASRGVSAAKLSSSSLWWHGPDWLRRYPEYWPNFNNELPDTQLEQRVQWHTTATTLLDDVSERFSCYGRALRVTAYILRVATKTISTPSMVHLTNDELLSAKSALLRISQRREYVAEIRALVNGDLLYHRARYSI